MSDQVDYDPYVCNQCGQCCHVGVSLGKTKITLRKVVCKHLRATSDNKTQCSVYPKRFKVAPWCLSVGEAVEQERLPKSCPYVKDLPDYEGTNYIPLEDETTLVMSGKANAPRELLQIAKSWDGPMGE